mgnify:CR=1 FL=1
MMRAHIAMNSRVATFILEHDKGMTYWDFVFEGARFNEQIERRARLLAKQGLVELDWKDDSHFCVKATPRGLAKAHLHLLNDSSESRL